MVPCSTFCSVLFLPVFSLTVFLCLTEVYLCLLTNVSNVQTGKEMMFMHLGKRIVGSPSQYSLNKISTNSESRSMEELGPEHRNL